MKKIITAILLIGAITAFESCKKEDSTPDATNEEQVSNNNSTENPASNNDSPIIGKWEGNNEGEWGFLISCGIENQIIMVEREITHLQCTISDSTIELYIEHNYRANEAGIDSCNTNSPSPFVFDASDTTLYPNSDTWGPFPIIHTSDSTIVRLPETPGDTSALLFSYKFINNDHIIFNWIETIVPKIELERLP